jgi:hypothetical protein
MSKCGMKTEVYSRVCGYHRPVMAWNKGKRAEFADRKVFSTPKSPNLQISKSPNSEVLPCAHN